MPILVACGAAEAAGVRDAIAGWQGRVDATAKRLTLDLFLGGARADGSALEFQVSGAELRLRGGGVDGVADAARRQARCTLSPDWFKTPAEMLAQVLEPLALFMATKSGRVPLHASAIQVGDLAILFAGPGGAGKSTLALAAHRAGLTVLSEDTVYVRTQPELAIWGWAGPIHLLPGEAGADAPVRIRNGRAKHAVAFTPAPPGVAPTSAVMCILGREGSPSLTPLTASMAIELLSPLEPGFDLLAREILAVHRQLCQNGAWLLRLSKSPDEAIALVSKNLGRLRDLAHEGQSAVN